MREEEEEKEKRGRERGERKIREEEKLEREIAKKIMTSQCELKNFQMQISCKLLSTLQHLVNYFFLSKSYIIF
jgi:hypothetical protein